MPLRNFAVLIAKTGNMKTPQIITALTRILAAMPCRTGSISSNKPFRKKYRGTNMPIDPMMIPAVREGQKNRRTKTDSPKNRHTWEKTEGGPDEWMNRPEKIKGPQALRPGRHPVLHREGTALAAGPSPPVQRFLIFRRSVAAPVFSGAVFFISYFFSWGCGHF